MKREICTEIGTDPNLLGRVFQYRYIERNKMNMQQQQKETTYTDWKNKKTIYIYIYTFPYDSNQEDWAKKNKDKRWSPTVSQLEKDSLELQECWDKQKCSFSEEQSSCILCSLTSKRPYTFHLLLKKQPADIIWVQITYIIHNRKNERAFRDQHNKIVINMISSAAMRHSDSVDSVFSPPLFLKKLNSNVFLEAQILENQEYNSLFG